MIDQTQRGYCLLLDNFEPLHLLDAELVHPQGGPSLFAFNADATPSFKDSVDRYFTLKT